jgi:hypothetical protein
MANGQNRERFCPKGRHVVVPHEGRKLCGIEHWCAAGWNVLVLCHVA